MMNKNRFSLISLVLIMTASISVAGTDSKQEIEFDYQNETEVRVVKYDSSISIKLINVNTADYDYEAEITAVAPTPHTGPVMSIPAPGVRALLVPPNESQCRSNFADLVTEKLAERRSKFGKKELEEWFEGLKSLSLDSQCNDTGGSWPSFRDSQWKKIGSAGSMAVERISQTIMSTGPGGAIEIAVVAKPKPNIKIEWEAGEAIKLLQDDSADPIANADHLKPRKFVVRFGPPRGVSASFGPFVSSLTTKKYGRISQPASSDLVVGLKEESDIGYGLAAFWSAPLLGKAQGTWGVAYTFDNEIDESVKGLLGVSFKFKQESALTLHLGAAIGIENELGEGWKVGQKVAADKEIPIKKGLEVGWFFGLGFSWGGSS
jgi:hypothetical protein